MRASNNNSTINILYKRIERIILYGICRVRYFFLLLFRFRIIITIIDNINKLRRVKRPAHKRLT